MTSITNDNAITDPPVNYEVCQRTGFRVPKGTLRQEWSGLYVRPESFEHKHDALFVKSKPERQRGSPRPEPDTLYITTEVTPESL
jgi:hypothetical protein